MPNNLHSLITDVLNEELEKDDDIVMNEGSDDDDDDDEKVVDKDDAEDDAEDDDDEEIEEGELPPALKKAIAKKNGDKEEDDEDDEDDKDDKDDEDLEEASKDILQGNVKDARKNGEKGLDKSSAEDLGGPTPEKSEDKGGYIKSSAKGVKKNKLDAKGKPSDKEVKSMTKTESLETAYENMRGMKKEHITALYDTTNNLKETLEIDVTEDVNALFGKEELSEDFKNKAKTIFEAAVKAKVNEEVSKLDEKFGEAFDALTEDYMKEFETYTETVSQEITGVVSGLTENIDDYLSYIAKEWREENQIALDRGVRNEYVENFMSGLHTLFEDHYVTVPEESDDLVEKMAAKIEKLEEDMNTVIKENINITKANESYKKDSIFSEIAEGLTFTQVEKLQTLSENVSFDNADNWKDSVTTLRESYFGGGSNNSKGSSDDINFETDIEELNEEEIKETKNVFDNDDGMSPYLSALDRMGK
jgi:hypothetical protein